MLRGSNTGEHRHSRRTTPSLRYSAARWIPLDTLRLLERCSASGLRAKMPPDLKSACRVGIMHRSHRGGWRSRATITRRRLPHNHRIQGTRRRFDISRWLRGWRSRGRQEFVEGRP